MKKIVQLIIQIIIIGGLILYITQNKSALEPLLKIKNTDVVIILVLIFISNHIRSAQLQYFTYALGNKITYGKAFSITVGGTLLNYLPLNAGMFFKAAVLKKLNIQYAHFVSLTSVEILVTLIASSAFGIMSLTVNTLNLSINYLYVYFFFFMVFLLSIIMLFIPSSWFVNRKGKFLMIIRSYLEGIEQIIFKTKIVIWIFIFIISRLLITSLIILKCFTMLGSDISFFGSIFVATATSLLMIINITPGGVGIREIIIGTISTVTGGAFAIGVFVSAIMRACSIIIHIFFGIPSLLYLKKNKIV